LSYLSKNTIEVEVIGSAGEHTVVTRKKHGNKIVIDKKNNIEIDFELKDVFLMKRPVGFLRLKNGYIPCVRWREGTTKTMPCLGLRKGDEDYLPALTQSDSKIFVKNQIYKLSTLKGMLSNTQFYVLVVLVIVAIVISIIGIVNTGPAPIIIPNYPTPTPTATPVITYRP
jgi:hypothetical protein